MAIDASEVARDMNVIQIKIQELLWEYDAPCDTESIGRVGNEDFTSLLRRCLGVAPGCEVDLQQCRNMLRGISLRQIVCSLVSAAIATWVFEDDIKAFFHRGSLVCSTYHSLVAAQSKRADEF